MDIKWPWVRIIRPQQIDVVTDIIIRHLLLANFWVAFIGWYQIWQWVKPYLELLKLYLEKL